MKKVKIIKPFVDKYNLSRAYCPGEEVLFDEERAAHLVRLGLGETPDAEEEVSQPNPETESTDSGTESANPDAEEETLFSDESSPSENADEKPKRKTRSKK